MLCTSEKIYFKKRNFSEKRKKGKGKGEKKGKKEKRREKEHSAVWRGELREKRKIWRMRDKAAETVTNEVWGGQTFLDSMPGPWKEGPELHTEEGPASYKHTHIKYVQELMRSVTQDLMSSTSSAWPKHSLL